MEDDRILIRPDPDNMPLMFAADEVLSRSSRPGRCGSSTSATRKSARPSSGAGQCWRITPLPKTPQEMVRMIAGSRIGIEGREESITTTR